MTRNEQIASIMLEAAELLKEDNQTLNEDYYNYSLFVSSMNECRTLCEQISRVVDRYENDILWSLNESIGSKIWEGIKKLCRMIRDALKRFRKWITSGGKKVAKEDGEVVDPQKASRVVDKVESAYNSNKEEFDVDTDNLNKKVKKGDPIPNYDSVESKIDNITSKIEKETDEMKAKNAKEALTILKNLSSGIEKSSQLFLPRGGDHLYNLDYKQYYDKNNDLIRKDIRFNENGETETKKYRRVNNDSTKPAYMSKWIIKDKDGNVKKYRRNSDYYGEETLETDVTINNGKTKGNYIDALHNNTLGKKTPYYVNEKGQASDTLPEKKKVASKRKQTAKAKGKNMNETIEFLYDQALLAETIEEFDTIMEAIYVLE